MSERAVTLAERFWLNVSKSEDCWLWTGSRDTPGYGLVRFAGKTYGAHRVSYELHIGPIPTGLQIDHLCRVRHCVNPAHLEAVTCRENVLRGEAPPAKQARQTACKRGHPFDAENTKVVGTWRICRTCKRAKDRAAKRAMRAYQKAVLDDGTEGSA